MSDAAFLLRQARRRAGLSQRSLAERARTAQSAIARIERGQTSPTWDTLVRLIEAAGFSLKAEVLTLAPGITHMLDDVPRILALSPEQRLAELANASQFFSQAQRA
jgi:transcriptional regulator with XRE-family HTH domain